MTSFALRQELKKMWQNKNGERFFSENALRSALFEKNQIPEKAKFMPDFEIPRELAEKIFQDANRLLDGYPIQYYLGSEFFDGAEFIVPEGVLIPRADSEVLVREAENWVGEGDFVFDFCCGTGCIGIALLLRCPSLRLVSFDLSDAAIAAAEKNRALHRLENRMRIEKMDVLSPEALARVRRDAPKLILANPPYISASEMRELEINVQNEPRTALYGGEDGLMFYRSFFDLYSLTETPMILEIGWKQGGALKELLTSRGIPFSILPDPSGRDRCLVLGKFANTARFR